MTIWDRIFKDYEKPSQKKVFRLATAVGIIKYFLISFLVTLGILFIGDFIVESFGSIEDDGSNILGVNALVYIVHLFFWAIPAIMGSTIYSTQQCPTYGFTSILAVLAASWLYMLLDYALGGYLVFCALTLIFANLMSQGDYKIKTYQVVYYILLGIAVGYYNIRLMLGNDLAIWTYLQVFYFHTSLTIIIGLKIEPWAYFYMSGWAAYTLYYMIAVNLLLGIYVFSAPLILTGGCFLYFNKIYLPMKRRGGI